MAAPPTAADVLRGTLDLLVLKTLTLEPMHGWGISQRIQQFSRGVLDVTRARSTPPFSVSSRKAGSRASGAPPRTIAEQSITA